MKHTIVKKAVRKRDGVLVPVQALSIAEESAKYGTTTPFVNKVVSIITDIERFLADVDSLKVISLQDLDSKKNFYASSMLLFAIANRTIDLGEQILSVKKLGFPGVYKDIFDMLFRAQLIYSSLHADLLSLVRFRNLAPHEYQSFTPTDVHNAIKVVSCVPKFIAIVKKSLK